MQYDLSVPVYAWVTIPPRIGLHVYIIKLKVLATGCKQDRFMGDTLYG